ncbi:YkgJ family cysteine cluster protein [Dendrosporobacter sp. 1207_IL3150]|uniref:YkgJ family cysteine cluster protein n=1 Tax=Dendrosporobacter sp. 1207_IL3150 TaxID=3084054 RepID=UPI002FDB6A12
MKIIIDPLGSLDCITPYQHSTVADLINAMAEFCQDHIDCSACKNTCCSGLTIYADNIFIEKLSLAASKTIMQKDLNDLPLHILKLDSTMRWVLLPHTSGVCKFLSSRGKCLIYNSRPLVCRIHTCLKCTPNFTTLKDSLYFAYQEALKVEMQNLLAEKNNKPSDYWVSSNPLVGLKDYDTKISTILNWVECLNKRKDS